MAEKNESGLYEVEIDDKKYEFEKWGAEESLSNLIKLSKIIGKPLGLAIGAFKQEEKEETSLFDTDMKDINIDMLGLALQALTENLDESACIALIKKLSSQHVLCDGAKINFNTHYADRLDHLFRVVGAALEVQYGNFFAAVLGLARTRKGKGITQALRT